jgi:hypothetical protein
MGKIKKAFVLFFVAGLLSPVTGGLTMLLYSLGVIYVLFGSIAIEAAINLPILLIKLMLFPFTLVFGTFKKTTIIGKGFWHTGLDNIRRSSWKEREREEEEDEDEDESALGYVEEGLSLAVEPLTKFKLRYGVVLLFFIWVLGYPEIFSTVMSDPTQVIELDNIFMIFLLGLPFILTVVFSSFMGQIFGNYKKFWKWGDSGIGDAAESIAGTAGAATGSASVPSLNDVAQSGKEAHGDFKDIKGYGKKGAKGIEKGAEGAAKRASSMAEGTSLEGALQGTKFESLAGSVGGASGGILLAFLLIVIAVIFYAGVLAVVGSLVGALTWGWFNFMLPFFAEPIMAALGLGGAYGQWFGESTANTVGPQIGGVFEEEIRMLKQGFAKVGCFAKGPQCIRQWRMNNTVRPGSDAEGESYELRIAQFGMGRDRIDKAYKEANYTIPVNFLIENTRHGLKGINARDVSYKINVESYDEVHCTTGWTDISTFPGQPDKNYILPGLGVSPTQNNDLDELNLGNCDLLQPSMGQNRVLTLSVKYDYSSQATLYVDAMSREYRREKGIMPSFKKSRTARTPVQSYVNVKAPVTFFETEGGERLAVPFNARFGFETPGYDVEYKVHPNSVDIRDSSRTTHVADNCPGLEWEGDNEYRVSNEAEERIELRQEDRWFSANVDPAPLRCTMKIEDGDRPDDWAGEPLDNDLNLISPTGQQLIMRIDGNYTVKRERSMQDFDVWNTRCTRITCPMVVTEEYNESSEYELFSECTSGNSVDSRDGCTIRVPEGSSDEINWREPNLAEKNGERIVIQPGETAHTFGYLREELNTNFPKDHYDWEWNTANAGDYNTDTIIMGIDETELDSAMVSEDGVAIYREEYSDDLQYKALEWSVCDQAPNLDQFMEVWKEENDASQIVAIRVNRVDCVEMLESWNQLHECNIDWTAEVIQTATGWNTFVEGGGLFGDTDTACDELSRWREGCGENEIRAIKDGEFQCYG